MTCYCSWPLLFDQVEDVSNGAELFRVNDRPTFALTSSTPFYRTLAAGDEGPDVKALQTLLRDLDYYKGDITGEYDADSQEAVRDFLEDRGQDRTENVGPETFQAVGPVPAGGGTGSRGAPMVARLDLSVGEVVQPGMTALVTAPRQGLEAVIDVNELDIPSVEPDSKATLTLDALPGQEFTGVVKTVSPGTVQPETSASAPQQGASAGPRGVVTFPVTIAFDAPSAQILAGMSVDADIILATARLVLAVPSGAVQDRDGAEVVLVPAGTADASAVPVAVPVSIGLRSDDLVEVTGGLSEGQTIVVGLDPDSIDLPDQGLLGLQSRPNALPIGTDTSAY